MLVIPNSTQMQNWTFRPQSSLCDQAFPVEVLEDIHHDALHTVGVHPIHNQFWQYRLCNVYQHWQAEKLY